MAYAVFWIYLTYTIKDYNLLWHNGMQGEIYLRGFKQGILAE